MSSFPNLPTLRHGLPTMSSPPLTPPVFRLFKDSVHTLKMLLTWPDVAKSGVIIGVTLVVFILLLYRHEYKSWARLSHIPGPRFAQFTNLWILKHAWNGRLAPCLTEAGEEYGDLVRIGPNLLLCSDPDELRQISSVRTEYTKGPAYDAGRINDGDTHVASERDPVKHKALRAKMGPAYSSSEIQPAIDRQVSLFISLLQSKYACPEQAPGSHPPGKILNLGQMTQFYALDCIGDFAFGRSFGFLVTDEDPLQITQLNDQSLRMVTVAGLAPWMNSLKTVWPFTYLVPHEGDKSGFGILQDFAKNLVEERTAPDPYADRRKDFMQAFIGSGMDKQQLVQQVYLHIIAGADSTSNWLRMVMLCLMTCPPAYKQLQAEIDTATQAGALSFPTATDAEARGLPYLDAVLREAIRMHPPAVAPSKLTPLAPSQHTTVCGYSIPGGTQIGANTPGMFRSRDIFGADAECFRPERWLYQGNTETISRMKSTVDLVFGAGKFHCMGKEISGMETRKLVVELMRRFDFSLVDNIRPLRVESLAITVVHDFRVRVTTRSRFTQ